MNGIVQLMFYLSELKPALGIVYLRNLAIVLFYINAFFFVNITNLL